MLRTAAEAGHGLEGAPFVPQGAAYGGQAAQEFGMFGEYGGEDTTPVQLMRDSAEQQGITVAAPSKVNQASGKTEPRPEEEIAGQPVRQTPQTPGG
ncbi:MAG: hypothetical protein FJ399_09350 [Verrucomicrobia bacterium]|nr:hypothetical protein [Verrucomicrobiota bacterium]